VASMDLYSYCNGDPVNQYDADGKLPMFINWLPAGANPNWLLVGRSAVGVVANGVLMVGGAAAAPETGGAGAVMAFYGATQMGGYYGNMINGLTGASAGPTGPAQIVSQVGMLASGVQSDSKTWNAVDTATQLADAAVPLVLSGTVNSALQSQLVQKTVGNPGTLAGALTRVDSTYNILNSGGLPLAATADFGLTAFGIADSFSQAINGKSLYNNISGRINKLNQTINYFADAATPPSRDPLSAQPAKWK